MVADLDGDGLWEALQAATHPSDDGSSAAEIRRLAVVRGRPLLGWINPPSRPEVAELETLCPPAGVRLLVLATGGWAFAARALGALREAELTVLDAPHQVQLEGIRQRFGDRSPMRAIAISESASTLETRLLVAWYQRTSFEHGLAGSLTWLTDAEHGLDAPTRPLAFGGRRDLNALFAAPFSPAFLLVALKVFGAEKLQEALSELEAQRPRIGRSACIAAARVPCQGAPVLGLRSPRAGGEAARLWVQQLARQALCGKPGAFRPRVKVSAGPLAEVAIDLREPDRPPLVELMVAFYRAAVFVAAVGARAALRFAEHEAVDAYKALLDRPPSRRPDESWPPSTAGVRLVAAVDRLRRERPREIEIVFYEPRLARALGPGLRELDGLGEAIYEGPAWNHHSFQAAWAERDLAILLITEAGSKGGASTLSGSEELRVRDIAAATRSALGDRALWLELEAAEVAS